SGRERRAGGVWAAAVHHRIIMGVRLLPATGVASRFAMLTYYRVRSARSACRALPANKIRSSLQNLIPDNAHATAAPCENEKFAALVQYQSAMNKHEL